MNDRKDARPGPPQRFVLTLWLERRESGDAAEVLRGSIVGVSPAGAADPEVPPRRAYFETLEGLAPALRRLLAHDG